MTFLSDSRPPIDVLPAEYDRLLGYPAGAVRGERSLELADWARSWYAEHGRPWIYARRSDALECTDTNLSIEGSSFTSPRLRRMLRDADAHSVFLLAVSAGPEVEAQARRLWEEEKPDEYFFLEMFGSAVVEHLITNAGARLCAWADGPGLAVLPHYSPGYPEWDIAEQGRLLSLIGRDLPGPLEALDSGALRPKKAQTAIFGVAPMTDRLRRFAGLIPCQTCSLAGCQYRRVPPAPAYSVNLKALKRWAGERVQLDPTGDGGVHARFRFDGTTCSNLGQPLTFYYDVRLGSAAEGYPIREQHCAPAPCDKGHTAMCKYLTDGPSLLAEVDREKPLSGQPLADVFSWKRAVCSTGCYCEPASREHKWGLVLETIHYAIAQAEISAPQRLRVNSEPLNP
jgi:hypothetical protein